MSTTVNLARPARRWPVRLFNGIASRRPSFAARLELNADELIDRACRHARLENFGGDDFLTPFRLLINDINVSANLTDFGRFAWKGMLHTLLCNRLFVEARYDGDQGLEGHSVAAPVFILGFPRTGSTFLHRLLACDPAARYLSLAESMRVQHDPRRRATPHWLERANASWGLTLLNYLAPGFDTIHAEPVDGPAECGGLLLHSFQTVAFLPSLNVPRYAAWLDQCDFSAAARYHRRQLGILDHRRPAGHWLLKSPAHLPMIDALLTVYPGAKFIFLHRDPVRVVSSFSSLVALTQGIYSDTVSGRSVGAETSRILHGLLSRALQARENWPSSHFIDVQYADLVRDPMGTVARIYDALGLSTSGSMKAAVAQLVAGAAGGKHTRHRYELAQFGLDVDQLRAQFQSYSRQFGVAEEPTPR